MANVALMNEAEKRKYDKDMAEVARLNAEMEEIIETIEGLKESEADEEQIEPLRFKLTNLGEDRDYILVKWGSWQPGTELSDDEDEDKDEKNDKENEEPEEQQSQEQQNSGYYQTQDGYYQTQDGYYQTQDGYYQTQDGYYQTQDGNYAYQWY